MDESEAILDDIGRRAKERFEKAHAILSFGQFLDLLHRQPYSLTRNAPQYIADMMDHFGSTPVRGVAGPVRRFQVFDDAAGKGDYAIYGQEEAQDAIYRALREFVQRRRTDRMLLLHGPNGSSKTSLVAALVRGLEAYSRTDEGMLVRFNWIFSEGADRGDRLGFDPVRDEERLDTFAFLDADRVSAKIPCELSDNPIFLIPKDERARILTRALATASAAERDRFVETRILEEGDLSPKARRIHDSLLAAYRGDWRKVMRHVQVERFFISRRFRTGAVAIEPQANIDAHSRQIGHSSMNGLPPVLQNETLFEAFGDLVDANRGIVEYSDFCKRPMEVNKYLLTAAENGVINLQSYTASLDVVMVGTSNENYLSAFRRDPIFPSFKARLDLIRVPYLLQYSKEQGGIL